jgi:hypothetical protein
MSHYLEHLQFYNQPVRLSQEFKKAPITFLHRFFCDYHLADLRQLQKEILETCLTTDIPPFCDPAKRADLLLLHKNVELLFEAAFLIMKNWEAEQSK